MLVPSSLNAGCRGGGAFGLGLASATCSRDVADIGGEGRTFLSLPLPLLLLATLPLDVDSVLCVEDMIPLWPLEDLSTCMTRSRSSDTSARFIALPALLA